jgi:hypothetical protein
MAFLGLPPSLGPIVIVFVRCEISFLQEKNLFYVYVFLCKFTMYLLW